MCVFPPHLFNFYSEKLIGGCNRNNVRHTDDTMLMTNSKEKLKELLNKVVAECLKNGLTLMEILILSVSLERTIQHSLAEQPMPLEVRF